MTPRRDDLVVGAAGRARFLGRDLPCSLGRAGLTDEKREGDGATPRGVFHIEAIYHRIDRWAPPPSLAPRAPIRAWDGWSDDPRDPAYNQRVRLPRGSSAERMRRADPLYDLVAVLDANRAPVKPGAGSAIFLHVWRRPRFPTAGCVAFARRDLAWILARWTPLSRVVIR